MGVVAAVVLAGSIGAAALSAARRARLTADQPPVTVKVNSGVPNVARPAIATPCKSCSGDGKTLCSRCNGRGAQPL